MSITLDELSARIMKQAEVKGLGTRPEEISVPEKMVLLHSEVSEAYDAYRHKNIEGKDGFNEELADVLIRLLHLAAIMRVDIEYEAIKKMEYNESREWRKEELNENLVDTKQ